MSRTDAASADETDARRRPIAPENGGPENGGAPAQGKTGASSAATGGYTRDPHVQLMMRCRHGDDEAFTQLVTAYQDRVIGIFTPVVGSREVAEDLAQELFMRVYRARKGYEPTAKFSTWLFRIANNLASNTRRSKGRRKEVQFAADTGAQQPLAAKDQALPDEDAQTASRQLDRREMQRIVRESLESLPERQRLAILLSKFEGMSYEDIAETMELSTAAVKSLLARARENLRVQLEKVVR